MSGVYLYAMSSIGKCTENRLVAAWGWLRWGDMTAYWAWDFQGGWKVMKIHRLSIMVMVSSCDRVVNR